MRNAELRMRGGCRGWNGEEGLSDFLSVVLMHQLSAHCASSWRQQDVPLEESLLSPTGSSPHEMMCREEKERTGCRSAPSPLDLL